MRCFTLASMREVSRHSPAYLILHIAIARLWDIYGQPGDEDIDIAATTAGWRPRMVNTFHFTPFTRRHFKRRVKSEYALKCSFATYACMLGFSSLQLGKSYWFKDISLTLAFRLSIFLVPLAWNDKRQAAECARRKVRIGSHLPKGRVSFLFHSQSAARLTTQRVKFLDRVYAGSLDDDDIGQRISAYVLDVSLLYWFPQRNYWAAGHWPHITIALY